MKVSTDLFLTKSERESYANFKKGVSKLYFYNLKVQHMVLLSLRRRLASGLVRLTDRISCDRD